MMGIRGGSFYISVVRCVVDSGLPNCETMSKIGLGS